MFSTITLIACTLVISWVFTYGVKRVLAGFISLLSNKECVDLHPRNILVIVRKLPGLLIGLVVSCVVFSLKFLFRNIILGNMKQVVIILIMVMVMEYICPGMVGILVKAINQLVVSGVRYYIG